MSLTYLNDVLQSAFDAHEVRRLPPSCSARHICRLCTRSHQCSSCGFDFCVGNVFDPEVSYRRLAVKRQCRPRAVLLDDELDALIDEIHQSSITFTRPRCCPYPCASCCQLLLPSGPRLASWQADASLFWLSLPRCVVLGRVSYIALSFCVIQGNFYPKNRAMVNHHQCNIPVATNVNGIAS